jgi:hypothetical protein
MTRRTFLAGAGVVTVLVAGGGVWRAFDRGVFNVGEGPAYEPWKNWRGEPGEGALALVRAAILAANPHNTQPWLFRVAKSRIELYLDTKRNVGALDPFLREEHIGLGCALENLMLAARAGSYNATLNLLPGKLGPIPGEPKPKLVARIDLAPGKPGDSELYAAIPHRHTNRSAYIPQKPVPPQFIDALSRVAGDETDVRIFLFQAEADRRRIVQASATANVALYSDPEIQRGTDPWFRLAWRSVQKFRDGLAIDNFGEAPVAAGFTKMLPAWVLQWASAREEKTGYADLMLSAPLIGMLAVRDRYDQEQCLRAGRIWQRAHLLATARGLAGRPCNEAVELVDREKALGKPAKQAGLLGDIIGDATWQPTFVFYMGTPTWPGLASARRPVEAVVL